MMGLLPENIEYVSNAEQIPAFRNDRLHLKVLIDFSNNEDIRSRNWNLNNLRTEQQLRDWVEENSDIVALFDITDSRLDFVGDARFGAVPVHELKRRRVRSVDMTGRETTIPGALRADDEFFESPDYDIPDPTFVAGNRELFDRFMRVYTEIEESIGRD